MRGDNDASSGKFGGPVLEEASARAATYADPRPVERNLDLLERRTSEGRRREPPTRAGERQDPLVRRAAPPPWVDEAGSILAVDENVGLRQQAADSVVAFALEVFVAIPSVDEHVAADAAEPRREGRQRRGLLKRLAPGEGDTGHAVYGCLTNQYR